MDGAVETAPETGQNLAGAAAGPELSSPTQKKRSRIRFSCTTCRDKKLKCDRQSPCDQCLKRGIEATCEFIPYVSGGPRSSQALFSRHKDLPATQGSTDLRSKPTASDSAVQVRLRHLEHLVQVLKAGQRQNASTSAQSSAEPVPEGEDFEDDEFPRVCARVRETAGMIVNDLRYVDASHWESILSDVLTITGSLERPEDLLIEEDDPVADYIPQRPGPDLLLGGYPPALVDDMIRHLPSRPTADRLLARLFQAKGPGFLMFHMPTFLKHYEQFWQNPGAMTFTQLGLLFAMFCNASLYYMQSGEELPELGNAGDAYRDFKYRCAHCLVLDDYTKPGPYKIETLILYFGCEYLGNPDASTTISVILSIIVRLAMHMGMHRDARHYPQMSAFEGEMRRRTFTVLRDVDILIGFQFGLPGNIQNDLYDTALPSNLHDEDFDESTKVLPPSRPETERTVCLWPIMKGRIVNAFSEITTTLNSRKPASFADIMRLNRHLDDLRKQFPPSLRHRPFSQSVVDPVDLIMQRYQLELLFLKCRIVLNRRYMGVARKYDRYEYCRKVCLDAATKTLRHQYDIHCELQLGGRLSHDRNHWFLSSLSTHNFLLADMILCLELWCLKAKERSPDASTFAVEQLALDKSSEIMSKEQLLEILRTSRLIWQGRRKESAEANKAFNILTKMLNMSTGESFESSPESTSSYDKLESSSYPNLPSMTFAMETGPNPAAMAASAAAAAATNMGPNMPVSDASMGWTNMEIGADGQIPAAPLWTPGYPEIPALNDAVVLDQNLSGDWVMWDNQILNSTSDGASQIPWDTFFHPSGSGY